MNNQPALRGDKPRKKVLDLSSGSRKLAWDILIGILTFALIYAILITAVSPEKYELKVGDISPDPIAAPRDVEDRLATEARIEIARANVEDKYSINEEVMTGVVAQLDDIFNQIDLARYRANKRIENWKKDQLEEQASQEEQEANPSQLPNTDDQQSIGQVEDVLDLEPDLDLLFDDLFLSEIQDLFPIELTKDSLMTLLSCKDEELDRLKTGLEESVKKIQGAGIKSDEIEKAKQSLASDMQVLSLTSDLRQLATTIGSSVLKPNYLYDQTLTNQAKDLAASQVEKVIYIKGQYIVNAGQPITEAQMEMLSELGLLKDKVDFSLIFGVFVAVFICLGIIVLYIFYFEKELLDNPIILLMIGLILILSLGLSYVTSLLNPYLVPAAMAGMLLAILTKPRIAMVINMVLAVLISYMLGMQIYALLMTLAGGMVGIMFVQARQHRYVIVWAGIAVSLVSIMAILSSEMLSSGGWNRPLNSSFYGLMSGMLASVLTIGTLPIWENLFNIITPLRLMELANPNQPLLKRLLMETPGTYHHSIIVANLAESAADAIGANGLMARVGAYYHDVGKLVRPYYFKENQLYSENPHDKLNPVLSKKIITSHTKDGIELAKKYKIPVVIQDFISQHHGTTPVAYFFHKAKENNSDIEIEDFRYTGPKPTSKEVALVMLADTVEAAVRAMSDRNAEKIEEQIRKLIRDKLLDGQLDNAALTIKDLDTAATSFTKVISGIFHERIEYPDIKALDERTRKDK